MFLLSLIFLVKQLPQKLQLINKTVKLSTTHFFFYILTDREHHPFFFIISFFLKFFFHLLSIYNLFSLISCKK